jgi:hypothetical protein
MSVRGTKYVPLALTNVCFEGKNGHDAGVTPFPLMTQSGHLAARRLNRSIEKICEEVHELTH